MKTIDYLKAAKKALGVASDYALAKHLGVTRASISLLVNGHTAMSVTTAAKVAKILELDALKVIADVELERGSSPDVWKRIRDAAAWTAVAIGVACFGLEPQPALASGFNNNFFAVNSPAPGGGEGARSIEQKYTLRRIRRDVGAAIAALLGWLALVAL